MRWLVRLGWVALAVGALEGVAPAAGAEGDRPPRWVGSPWLKWKRLDAGCLMDVARMEFGLPVVDESALRVSVVAKAVDGGGEALRAEVRLDEGGARIEWPLSGAAPMRRGVEYVAKWCAEDAAGHVSCAPEAVRFTAPELDAHACLVDVVRAIRRAPAVPPMVEAPTERVSAQRARVDWRCVSAGAAGALLVLAVAGLAWARRAARRRFSRTA